MALEWLVEPITEEAPCGPDLDAEGDPDFLDYYYEAEARLPERYVIPGMAGVEGSLDKIFDPKTVNLRNETTEITALLRRSRDLRLLTLLARFQILAARLGDFADTMGATADLLATFPADVNPTAKDAASERRAALDALGALKTVVMPLQYLPLDGHADTTYRRYLVAIGQAQPRAGEEDIDRGSIMSGLSSPSNAQAVGRTHADLGRAAEALNRIAALAASDSGGRMNLDVQDALRTLTQIHDLIAEARPELGRWANRATEATVPAGASAPEQVLPAPAVPAGPTPTIVDRSGARAALSAAELYLSRHEPSSPALLLVAQARLLIGRPLIEALETLMPGDAGRAVIAFAPETGFSLPMERMKALSQSVLGGFDEASSQPDGADEPIPVPEPTSRGEVASLLHGVEAFYQRNEPASPIPILLARARGFMDKGFQAIVAELIRAPTMEPKG